eukprot:9900699-Heterocapsa_arctica.AAC.1
MPSATPPASTQGPAGGAAAMASARHSGEMGHWQPPSDLTSFAPPNFEEGLRLLVKGPSTEWLHDAGGPTQQARVLPALSLADQRRESLMKTLDGDTRFQGAAAAGGVFGVFLRNRIRHALEEDETLEPDVHAFAAQAVEFGSPELAQGAA